MTEAGWFVARGTGVMALILLSVVVVLGVGSRSGRPAFGLPRFAVSLVHRNAALLAIGLLTVHVVTLLFDPYAKLRVYDLFVPFGAAYRPLYMGLGTVASDIMLVLVVTSLLRRYLRPRLWRALHWLAYASWPAAFGHSIGTGTDSGELWMLAVCAACLVAVLGALGWRFVLWLRPRPRQGGPVPVRRAPEPARSRHAGADTAADGGARPARQWSYPSTTGGYPSTGTAQSAGYLGPVGYPGPAGHAAPAEEPAGHAPLTSGYATATTSGSLLDMYRKPAASYQPVSPSAPADEPPAAYDPSGAFSFSGVEEPAHGGSAYGEPAYGGSAPAYPAEPAPVAGSFAGYGQATYAADAHAQEPYADAGYTGVGYVDPGYAPAGYADSGQGYQAAVPASEPDWSDDLRYQPAAEYVAMYHGEGYDPMGSAYPVADPGYGTGTGPGYEPGPDPAYDPEPGPAYDATDMYRRTTYPPAGDSNSYRDDPHAVSSGWRR